MLAGQTLFMIMKNLFLVMAGANINRSGRIDYTRHIYEPGGIYLPASTVIGVLLTARLRTYARGSGSYAELNFAEPPTNWIRFQDLMYQGADI